MSISIRTQPVSIFLGSQSDKLNKELAQPLEKQNLDYIQWLQKSLAGSNNFLLKKAVSIDNDTAFCMFFNSI